MNLQEIDLVGELITLGFLLLCLAAMIWWRFL